MFKVNNRNTRTGCDRSGVFIVNFENISHLVLVFPLLHLSRLMSAGKLIMPPTLNITTQNTGKRQVRTC